MHRLSFGPRSARHYRVLVRVLWTTLVAILLTAAGAHAQWFPDGTVINNADFNQESPAIVSDASGGAIIAWTDQRNGGWDVYAQRVSANGELLWNADGVPIATGVQDQTDVAIVADGFGGAVLVWVDDLQGFNNFDLYAQRIGPTGSLAWGAGVPISTFIGSQENPVIVADGEGGAIIAWEDSRSGNRDVYTQRANFLGTRLWTTNGKAIATDLSHQADVAMIPDGIGGAIMVWEDFRDGTNGEVYAQRADAAGNVLWGGGGLAVTIGADVSGDFGRPVVAEDDQSGVIVAWNEGVTGDLRAQHVDFFANVIWTAGGISIGPYLPGGGHAIIADGAGGAIVAWDKAGRAGRVDAAGDDVDVDPSQPVQPADNGDVCALVVAAGEYRRLRREGNVDTSARG